MALGLQSTQIAELMALLEQATRVCPAPLSMSVRSHRPRAREVHSLGHWQI